MRVSVRCGEDESKLLGLRRVRDIGERNARLHRTRCRIWTGPSRIVGTDEDVLLVVDADVDAACSWPTGDEGQRLHVRRILDVCDQGAKQCWRSVVAAEVSDAVIDPHSIESRAKSVLLRERRQPRALEIAMAQNLEIQASRITFDLFEGEIEDVDASMKHGLRNLRAAAVASERFDRLARFTAEPRARSCLAIRLLCVNVLESDDTCKKCRRNVAPSSNRFVASFHFLLLFVLIRCCVR